MTDDPTPLETTIQTVARWRGWTVERPLFDPHGRYGFISTHGDRVYVNVVKRRSHDGLASFMRRVIEHDARPDDVLVFFDVTRYSDDTPTPDSAFAFDPATVKKHGLKEHGEYSLGPSAKGVEVAWYELPIAEWGTRLSLVAYEGAPCVPPGGVREGQAVLPDGGFVRGEEVGPSGGGSA